MKFHNFFKHLKDHRSLIVCFLIMIVFIDVVFFLDPHMKLTKSNIIYIDLFMLICLALYLIYDYHKKKKVFILFNSNDQSIIKMKEGLNNEQLLYFQSLSMIKNEKEIEASVIVKEKKEYREFINNWVHDIKTPISVMELIIETELSEQKVDIVNSLKEELLKITERVERALYYSKLDSFNQDYFIEETDVYSIVRSVVKSNTSGFISKNIGVSIPKQSLLVHTDKKWLRFIIHQIISNSLKYTHPQGNISFHHDETHTAFILHIKDNGCGIKKEDIKRIFNNGFTGYNGRLHPASTGLGLYLAKKLCEKLNLQLSAESEFGSYTIISILIPKTNDYLNVTKL